MGIETTESRWNGHTVSDLSDLTGMSEDALYRKMWNPRLFTLGEVAELAPHLGFTPAEYAFAVLA